MSQLKAGAALSYLSILLTNLIGLLLTPFIIKSLGNAGYGLYALIGSFVAYLTLMDLGLNNTIIRFVSRYRSLNNIEEERKFLGTVMLIYTGISVVLVIIGIILYYNLGKIFNDSLTADQIADAKTMFVILVFNLAITLPGGSFTAICNAYEQFVFPRLIAIIKYVLRALTVVAILSLGGNAVSLVIIDTLFNVLVVVLSAIYVLVRLKVRFRFVEKDLGIVKQILSYSIWIFLLSVTGNFLWNIGQFFLGIETSAEEVAVFAIGIMLGGFYGSFSTAVSSLFLPRATQMSINSTKEELLEMMIKIGRISLMILMFIFTGFISIGRDFIFLWVGKDYDNSWIVASLMMAAYTIPLIQNFANSLIEAYNKVAYKVKVYLICFSFGLLTGYVLALKYQSVGMITGIAGGWFIAQIIMNVYFSKNLELNIIMFFKRTFSNILFPVISLGSLLYLSGYFLETSWITIIIRISGYSILYWGIMFIFSMNDFEKQLIKIRK